MKVITTHLNSDFDCLASMMAAKKLFPDAKAVFSGSQEKGVRNFLKTVPLSLTFETFKHVDLEEVTHLILVDVNRKGKIGPFQPLLKKDGVEVTIFDHHPGGNSEHPTDKNFIRRRGATSTIFVELMREKGISLDPTEATVLTLGIYEDTGSLIFPSTTPEDLTAVAWLLEQGADLNVVSDFIRKGLDADQVAILNDLLESAETVTVHGIPVLLATASSDMYVEDLSLVTDRLRGMRGVDVLFVIARIEDRVCLIARSRLDAIDVSQITSEFGGGGHPTAAAATIRDLTLVQVRDRLVELLPDRTLPQAFAKDMITPHAVSVLESDPIQAVDQILTRFNFSMVPVLRDGRPTGLISRKIVDKAIHHNLSQELAGDFMVRDFKSAHPDTPFHQIEEWIIKQKQKLVPVTDPKSGQLLGIISRGDLLGLIYGDFRKNMEDLRGGSVNVSKVSSGRNVKHLIRDKIPDRIIQLLDQIRVAADEVGMQTFAVGGFVRDLLLGIPNYDLDVVVEGDGIEFARYLGEKLGGTIKTHKKFKTAKVSFSDGQVIDVATARIEFYEFPGALPKVVFGSIKNDLYRRDFSINALGIHLNGRHEFHLFDFFQGKRDIVEKSIRVLHNLSFVEDPTRIFRAIRFEQRFQFSIGKQSLYLMKSAIEKDLLSRISGSRIFNELLIMLKEENPKKAIRRMDDFGVLAALHPKIKYPPRLRKLLQAVDKVLSWYQFTFPEQKVKGWEVYLRALFDELTVTETAKACDRLSVPQGLREKIFDGHQARKEIESVLGKETAYEGSAIYDLLHPFSVETLLYFMARPGHPRKARPLVTYLSELQGTKQILRGRDLVQMGLRPGKQYSQILKKVFSAQLDGQVKTKEEAYRFARKLAN